MRTVTVTEAARNFSDFVSRVQIETVDFDLPVARRHAALWSKLEKAGTMIGPYNLVIAATALEYRYSLATLNIAEFKRVAGLKLVDLTAFA